MNLIINKIVFKDLLDRGYFSFLLAFLTVIILPIHVKYLPPFMILWFICWILENNSRIKMIWSYRTPAKVLFILFILYYVWQVAGLIYTNDIKMGLLNLFGRLSLVLFPFVLFYAGITINRRAKILMRVFALSTSLFLLLCFGYALYRSVSLQVGQFTFNPHPAEYPWLNYFYGSDLTLSQHPAYIAMYVLLSTFICFESWFDTKMLYRIWWLILGLLLIISQYFISSRAGILISLVLVPFYFILKFKELGKKRFSWLWIILIVISLLPVVVKNQRVDYLYGRVFNKQFGYERQKEPRLLIWKSAIKIANKNLFFGVGIGDVRTELALEYERIGEEKMAKERLNAHNEFLEILLENGIIGIVLFSAVFICMLYIAISDKNLLYAMFILISILFFLFETMLYRFAGVAFFALFSFLLIHTSSKKQILKNVVQIPDGLKD
ncbi:MAG: O-antigen ligase family protein [Bacteroidia bacterium]|nr:O-antigen ligase family protein [Bacteroidia bacterium]